MDSTEMTFFYLEETNRLHGCRLYETFLFVDSTSSYYNIINYYALLLPYLVVDS